MYYDPFYFRRDLREDGQVTGRSLLIEYSIRINQQYRICFKWEEGHAYEIEITDYH